MQNPTIVEKQQLACLELKKVINAMESKQWRKVQAVLIQQPDNLITNWVATKVLIRFYGLGTKKGKKYFDRVWQHYERNPDIQPSAESLKQICDITVALRKI